MNIVAPRGWSFSNIEETRLDTIQQNSLEITFMSVSPAIIIRHMVLMKDYVADCMAHARFNLTKHDVVEMEFR